MTAALSRSKPSPDDRRRRLSPPWPCSTRPASIAYPGSVHPAYGPSTSVIQDDGQLKLRVPKIRVEVVAGPEAGRSLELPGPEARVGTGADGALTLTDRTVSRHHLTLRVEDGGLRVIDAGSRNGTTVDGLRINDAFARPDSLIVLGATTLRLQLLSDVVEIPLSARTSFGSLLGASPVMRRLFAVLERLAPTETTVLIEGETGTGKELIAEGLHEESRRTGAPFIVFDCSAVSAQLIESELFGHVRGAFTGAVADRIGAFEAADGGTLFLDEIGELPLDLQPKLLRALERLEVRRVGTHEARTVDVRVVAATNRSLSGEVERGRFREDLYYRLAVVHVSAPPLRERSPDIPMLVEHFCRQYERRHGIAASLPEAIVRQFQTRSWPGNVRELRNAVWRALSIGVPQHSGEAVAPSPVEPDIDLQIPFKEARDTLIERFEKAYVARALAESAGNVSRAAETAQVTRKFIYRVINQHGLRAVDDAD